MNKDVILLGGIHGSGKSTLIKKLQYNEEIQSFKQRHLLNLVGEKYNLKWPETGINHNKLIPEVIEEFLNQHSNGIGPSIIDCHYAIRVEKAVRKHNIIYNIEYIPDIDPVFIKEISKHFNVKLVLCRTNNIVARERILKRNPYTQQHDYTLEGLVNLERAEGEYFIDLKEKLQKKITDTLLLDCNKNIEEVYKKLHKFIFTTTHTENNENNELLTKVKLLMKKEFSNYEQQFDTSSSLLSVSKYKNSINQKIVLDYLIPLYNQKIDEKIDVLKEDIPTQNLLLEIKTHMNNLFINDLIKGDIGDKKLLHIAKYAHFYGVALSSGSGSGDIFFNFYQTPEYLKKIPIFNDETFVLKRHIGPKANLQNMYNVLLKLKKLSKIDYFPHDIRYIISYSRLFDNKFNDYWLKQRTENNIPNRVLLREQMMKYGGSLGEEIILNEEKDVFRRVDMEANNSLTNAIKSYYEKGYKIQKGGTYIDINMI